MNKNIAVLGGSGFVGRRLINRLLADGHSVTVLSRNLDCHYQRFLPPRVSISTLNAYDPHALQAAINGHDVVINLVGILNEAGDDGRGFRRAHVDLTHLIISAMHDSGVRRLLQMSALNAGHGKSHYLQSRGEADAAVKTSELNWTIFQPSVIFGPEDGLFCRFAALLKLLPVFPLARAEAKFAPVFVGDVAEAFARAIDKAEAIGEVFELYGGDVLTLADIVRLTAQQLDLRRVVLPLPDVIGRLQAKAMDFFPGKPFSSDNYRSLLSDSVGGIDGLHRLGITPVRITERLPEILGAANDRQGRLQTYRERR